MEENGKIIPCKETSTTNRVKLDTNVDEKESEFYKKINSYKKEKLTEKEKIKKIKMLNYDLYSKELELEVINYNRISNDKPVNYSEITTILAVTTMFTNIYKLFFGDYAEIASMILSIITIISLVWIVVKNSQDTKKNKVTKIEIEEDYNKIISKINNINFEIKILEYLLYEEDNKYSNIN